MKPGQYVVFALDAERYGLPIESVVQILAAPKVTRVPKTHEQVLGMFELRGSMLPVLDTRGLLGLPAKEPRCTLVIQTKDRPVALVVDSVDRIVDFEEDNMIRSDDTVVGRHDGDLVLLLDVQAILPRLYVG